MRHSYIVLKNPRALFIPALIFMIGLLPACAALGDADSDRGATTVKQDIFGDSFTDIKYLEQGWTPADSLWFYNITQGSDMMPYDFFLALEQIDKSEPFRSNENMNRYRYLPQKATSSNPDGLPVGFVKDTYKGKDYIGVTCAACHTSQINYEGKGIRIDGGPAGADMETFVKHIAVALLTTQRKDELRKRFVENVLARGTYKTEDEVLKDLEKYRLRIANYTTVNSHTIDLKNADSASIRYGFARLDAFGRIYNRVLEHIISVRDLKELLRDRRVLGDRALTDEELESVIGDADNLLTSDQRDQIFMRLTELLKRNDRSDNKNTWELLGDLRMKLFIPANAPVSYPFLWDTPRHDYVQWNGLTENSGLNAIGRNAGEAIGVFGTLDWTEKKGFSLSAFLSGQGVSGTHISYTSSVNVHNLRRIESRLWSLQSPAWPEYILPAIDKTRVVKGESLFNKHCVSCHATIVRDDPDRRVIAHMTSVREIHTDPQMAQNAVQYKGYSGILRNQYVGFSVGNILLDRQAPIAALLTKVTKGVVATPDPDKWFPRRWAEWGYDLGSEFFHNEIKPSIKHGSYDPDTTVNPVASLKAYKARSLNGIWATAPYLHNGSVPTLYDLLLSKRPKNLPTETKEGKYRPDKFVVGSREFDTHNVGFKSSGYDGFIFDTSLPGNSNDGHNYGVKRIVDESREPVDPELKKKCLDETIKDEDLDEKKDKCLLPMNDNDRWDLVEYLKTL